MCYGCYEDAGKPVIINDKTKEAAQLVKYLYEQDGCSTGGYAHIVTDDWNLETPNVEWCINEAEKSTDYTWISKEGKEACIVALKALLDLTEEERYSTMAMVDNFIEYEKD